MTAAADDFYRARAVRAIRYRGSVIASGEEVAVAPSLLHALALWVRNGVAEPSDDPTRDAVRDHDIFVTLLREISLET